jgi:hypothetical protein
MPMNVSVLSSGFSLTVTRSDACAPPRAFQFVKPLQISFIHVVQFLARRSSVSPGEYLHGNHQREKRRAMRID